MAVNASQLASSGQYNELTRRLIFLILALIVYRIGTHIPVPGINPEELQKQFSNTSGGWLDMVNMFSGGAISRFSVFALGIMPYISASIVMQILAHVVPSLMQLKKEGQSGQRKISQYTRYGALLISVFQAVTIATMLEKTSVGLVIEPGMFFKFTCVVSLATGSMFLMWLGEQITERGLGNGISLLIFAGIVSGLPFAIGSLFSLVANGAMGTISLVIIMALAVAVTYFVVFVERGQRKVRVEYARRQVGNRVTAPQSSHLPLKLNMSGVIPAIFASAIIMLIPTALGWLDYTWVKNLAAEMAPGQLLYIIVFSVAIIFFCFFYTGIMYNSKEVAENLKKSGAYVPGIRPGIQTAKYLDKVLLRLTFMGSLYITLVCLLPEFLRSQYGNLSLTLGGTSLLIVVVVAMDFRSQVENYIMSQQYGSLLKKSGFQ